MFLVQILSELLGYVPLCTRPSQLLKNLTINNKYRNFQKCALWATRAGFSQIAKSRMFMYVAVIFLSTPTIRLILRNFFEKQALSIKLSKEKSTEKIPLGAGLEITVYFSDIFRCS